MKCRSVKVSHNVTMSDKLCPAIPALSLPPDGALSCHYNNLCLPARTEYIIYRKQISNGSNGDGTLIIAFDHVKTQTVEIWTYVINKGNYVRTLFFGFFFYHSIAKTNWWIEFHEYRASTTNHSLPLLFVFWQLVDDVLAIIMSDKYSTLFFKNNVACECEM